MAFGATVLGASGYAGGELVRLLAGHPALSLVAAGAHSSHGRSLGTVLPALRSTIGELVTLEQAAGTPADARLTIIALGHRPGFEAP